MDLRFRRSHESGANLHGACAESERGRDSPAVGYATGGDDRHSDRVNHRRNERSQSHHFLHGLAGIKTTAVAAGLHSLHDDYLSAGRFGSFCLGHRRRISKPSNTERLEPTHELRREKTHNGGDDRRASFEQRFALCTEVWWRGIAGGRSYRRAPRR